MPAAVDTRGAIDADGHILEPPDLWERYLETRYRARAIRIRANDAGLECLEYDGRPSCLMPAGFPGLLGGMGAPDIVPSAARSYVRSAPFGSMDPQERVQYLDRVWAIAQEHNAPVALHPTVDPPLMPKTGLAELPSTYFRRQCYVSIDPDERAVAGVIPFVGDDRFFWASDFPHPDHTAEYMHELAHMLAPLPAQSQRRILSENVTSAYGL